MNVNFKAAQTAAQAELCQKPVIGGLAREWPELSCARPAVIVNPAASPLNVLAWCWGEVKSLRMAADAMCGSGDHIDPEVVYAVFLHRLAPLTEVMHDALQALAKIQRQDGRGVVEGC